MMDDSDVVAVRNQLIRAESLLAECNDVLTRRPAASATVRFNLADRIRRFLADHPEGV